MSLTQSTLAGVRWTAAAGLVQRVVQFGLSVLLMRLLGPSAFGLIAMVLVFTGFASILSDLGFASAVVHKKATTTEYESTAFWAALATGAFFTALLLAGAPLLASFFDAPVLEPMARVVAVGFVATSVGAVPRALLQKEMRFGAIAGIDTVAIAASGLLAIILALFGAGVWSLVIQRLSQDTIRSLGALALARWHPSGAFSRESFSELVAYGGGLTGFNIVNYWSRNADNLLVGRVFGSIDLGLYTRAYSLMMLPLSQIMHAVTPVLFPALSSIQTDRERVKRVFLRVLRTMTFLTFPVSLGLVATAEPFVLALLGRDWIGVIPLLQILTLAGVLSSATSPLGSVFLAQGRTAEFFYLGLVSGGLNLTGIIVGTLAGDVVYVAWGVLGAHVAGVFVNYAVAGHLFDIRIKDVAIAVRTNFGHAAAMLLLVLITSWALSPVLSSAFVLAALIVVGAVVYLSLARLTASPGLADFFLLLRYRRFPEPPEKTEGPGTARGHTADRVQNGEGHERGQ